MSGLRFAIIGAGVIGRTHAHAIHELAPRACLRLVVDEIPERARNLAVAQSGAGNTGTGPDDAVEHGVSASEAFAREDIDAVAICTPSGRHADLAIAALDAGKHVIIEKPIDVTVKAARRVADAQARGSRTATVISQHRFDASSQVVRRAVTEGRLGRLTSGVASIAWWRSQDYYDSGDWRGTWELDGGGALMNQGIHTIDLLVWMLGEPVEVFARTACLAHDRIEVEDTAVATLLFANGALAVLHGTTAAHPGLTARLQVHGDRGSAVIDGDRLVYLRTADGGAEALPDLGSVATAGSDPSVLSQAHTDQYRDFLDAVELGRPPLVTVADGIRTLAVVRAIYASARTGKPVSLADQTA
ncbi:MAG TPA: Gfo/Idh/MocA family oxidoreductase [Pseudonocardiaceae bacterium]